MPETVNLPEKGKDKPNPTINQPSAPEVGFIDLVDMDKACTRKNDPRYMVD